MGAGGREREEEESLITAARAETGAYSKSSMWVQGPGHSHISRELGQKRSNWVSKSTHIGCQHCRWHLNPLCYKACPNTIFFSK